MGAFYARTNTSIIPCLSSLIHCFSPIAKMNLLFISLLLLPLISAAENEEVPTSSVTDPETSGTVSQPIDIPLREYNVSFHKSPAVNGTVSALDQSTLFIHNFTFNGTDRFAFFWAGENYNNTLPDNFTGTTFLNPEAEPHGWHSFIVRSAAELSSFIVKIKDKKESLGTYDKKNVTLHLPDGMKISQLKFLAVRSPDMEGQRKNWGHVRFPDEGLRVMSDEGLRVMSGSRKVLFSSLLLLVASGLTIFM